MTVTINVTTGNDTEGIILESALVSAIWPGASDAAVASGVRDTIKLQIFEAYVFKTEQTNYDTAQNFINQNTINTH